MSLSTSLRTTLAGRAMVRMGLRIALVIIATTVLSYWHLYHSLQESNLEGLRDYVDARSQGDSEQFQLAEIQTRMLTDEFMRRYKVALTQDASAEFNRIFSVYPDGLIRVRPSLNDYRRRATVFIRHDVPLTDDLKRRAVIGYQLLSEWGPLTTNRFLDSFMNMPEQLSINYAPFVDWSLEAKRETDIYTYETVWRSTLAKNPGRKPFWTSVYYDEGAKKWMLSHVTPGDFEGRWVVSSGHDIVIDDLVKRTVNQQLAGTYNLILRNDGQLIAHPKLAKQIEAAGGNLDVARLGDTELSAIVAAVRKSQHSPVVVEVHGAPFWVGIGRIRGPDWLFVTVYPKSLITAAALSNASYVLLLGAGALILEVLILFMVLRRQVTSPLQSLVLASNRLTHGDYAVRLDWKRPDEIGDLARSFDEMAKAIGERDRQLICSADELAHQVKLARGNAARLTALSDALPDPAFLVDSEGTVLEAFGNQQLYAVSNPVGTRVEQLLPAEFVQSVHETIHRCLRKNQVLTIEYPLVINEQAHWFEGVASPLPEGITEIPAVLWLARNITARKLAEIDIRVARDHLQDVVNSQTADLRQAKERADAANQAKTHFLSNVSHELRTPMHAILSFARLGEEKGEQAAPEKMKRYFRNIIDSGERMLALVNDLLDIEKLEAGKMVYQIQDNAVGRVVESVMVELEPLAQRQGIRIEFIRTGADDRVQCDATRIGQVIRNLLSNAIKFSKQGEQVEIKLEEAGKDWLKILVQDQGPGIPEAETELIFEKFVQSSRHHDHAGGTGLGLAICREIVRAHGGDIQVRNNYEGGTCFSFRLPRQAVALAQ